MQLDAQGRLILSVMTDEGRSEAVVEARLLDALWHTVLVTVDEDTNNLTVNVSNGGGLAVLSGSILRSLRLASSSPQFRIGAGMTACFREGPGVRFTKSDVIVNSDAVKWLSSDESCFLPDSCEGKFLFENISTFYIHGTELCLCEINFLLRNGFIVTNVTWTFGKQQKHSLSY